MYKYFLKYIFCVILTNLLFINIFGQNYNNVKNKHTESTNYQDTTYYYNNNIKLKSLQEEFYKINVSDIPTSYTKSTKDLALYIDKKFKSKDTKILATYKWIADNITYDLNENKYKGYVDQSTITSNALKTKQGVCMHFTNLFNEILNYMNIESYIIYGYVKTNNKVHRLPHSWNGVYYGNNIWYLFDITWASGHIEVNKKDSIYKKNYDFSYLFVDPEELIKTHMPYDYCWQMLDNPISHQEFYGNKKTNYVNKDLKVDKNDNTNVYQDKKSNNKFSNLTINYKDSLLLFRNSSKLDQLYLTFNRVTYQGVYNQLTYDYAISVNKEIEVYLNNIEINNYNNAVILTNKGNEFINKYVNYFNKQFNPEQQEEKVKLLLDSAYNNFKYALFVFENTDKNIIKENDLNEIKNYCIQQISFIEEQYLFVNVYYSTPKNQRKRLFYR